MIELIRILSASFATALIALTAPVEAHADETAAPGIFSGLPSTVGTSSCIPEPTVCCRLRGGYQVAPGSACAADGGRVADDSYCAQPRVCCRTGQSYLTISGAKCRPPSGRTVPIADCRLVCCRQEQSFRQMPMARCRTVGGEVRPAPQCLVRCCRIGNRFSMLARGECTARSGAQVSDTGNLMTRCRPVCCRTRNPDGTLRFRFLDPAQCRQQGGRHVEYDICRQIPAGPE